MAKDPRYRFASVKEFGEYLRRAHYDDSLAVFDPNKFALRLDTAAEAYQQGNLEFAQELVNELESEGYLTQENDEAAQGWIRLFDGNSHFGWTAGGGDWQISRNELVSDPGVQSWLRSTTSFSDFDLKFEAA